MAIDKSLRQHYQVGKKVDAFKEGFKNIAGKASDALTNGFAPTTKDQESGTFDLGSMVESQAKSYATKAILGKLGLGSLFPYIGIASWIAEKLGYKPSDLMTGYTSGFMPGQTQAQYEAARAARQTQARIDNLLSRKSAGKTYSQKNLNELTMGSKPGFYGNVPTVSRINLAKHLIDMPENLGDRGSITQTPTSLVNPIQQARDAENAKKAKEDAFKKEFAFEDLKGGPTGDVTTGPVTTAIAPPSILSQEGKKDKGPPKGPSGPPKGGPHQNGPGKGPGKGPGSGAPASGPHGNGGGQGGKGGKGGGRSGPSGRKAYGGLISKPLMGRSRDI